MSDIIWNNCKLKYMNNIGWLYNLVWHIIMLIFHKINSSSIKEFINGFYAFLRWVPYNVQTLKLKTLLFSLIQTLT